MEVVGEFLALTQELDYSLTPVGTTGIDVESCLRLTLCTPVVTRWHGGCNIRSGQYL